MKNLGTLINDAATAHPDKEAILQGEKSLTFGHLDHRIHKVKGWMQSLGLSSGDHLMLLMDNDYRFAEWLLGAMQYGAIPIPANTKVSESTMAYMVADARARLLVCTPEYKAIAQALKSESPGLEHLIVLDEETYETTLTAVDAVKSIVDVGENSTALMMYTSGSTGYPKGCVIGHSGTWWMVRQLCESFRISGKDNALIFGPLYHANALWCMFYPMLLLGGTMHIYKKFDAKQALHAIANKHPTYMSGTPSMFNLMLAETETINELDVTSMDFVLIGSAPSTEKLLKAISTTFLCEAVEGYGSTEAGTVTLTPRGNGNRFGTIGRPLSGVNYKIVDSNNKEIAPKSNKTGELCLQTPALLKAYYGKPDLLAKKVQQGWYHTGDLVSEDENGYLCFEGRTDDMINCGGENIYPKEVANLLLQHPDIVEAAVLSVEHKTKGRAPIAWAVCERGKRPAEKEIKDFAIANGPAYAHPRRVFFAEKLPLNGTEKVDFKKLRELTQIQIPNGL